MCTPLATATDSLILFVSFCLRMPVHPWMFWACLMVWLVLHSWIDLYIASPLLPTMSTSYCHSLHLSISLCCYCIIELYWLVSCLVLLHCIVYLHIPLRLQWVPVSLFSSLTCLLVIVFLLQEERFICIAIVYYYLCIATDIDIYCWYVVCFHNCWGQSPLPSPL